MKDSIMTKNTGANVSADETTVPHQNTGETVTVVKDGEKLAIIVSDEAETTVSKLKKLTTLVKDNKKHFVAFGLAAALAVVAFNKYNPRSGEVESDGTSDESADTSV